MKKLTQDVFKDAPEWVRSAAVDKNGDAYWYSTDKSMLYAGRFFHQFSYSQTLGENLARQCYCIGDGYSTKNWQNSAIDREVQP